MGLSLVTGPATEPLTVAEAKRQFRGNELTDEDDLVVGWIAAAREYVESFIHRPLLTSTWSLSLDEFCGDQILLPLPPVQSVSSITYLDTAGASQTWASSNYRLDSPTGPKAQRARITPAYGVVWPSTYAVTSAVTVTFVAGYGTTASSVPMSLIHAMQLLVGHWSENRMAVQMGVGLASVSVPMGVEALLWPYKAF